MLLILYFRSINTCNNTVNYIYNLQRREENYKTNNYMHDLYRGGGGGGGGGGGKYWTGTFFSPLQPKFSFSFCISLSMLLIPYFTCRLISVL